MSKDRRTMSDVRQVLMNELGLTRDSIRAEMTRITEETFNRYVNSDQFRQFVERQIVAYFRQNGYEVKGSACRAIEKIVRERLQLTFQTPSEDES